MVLMIDTPATTDSFHPVRAQYRVGGLGGSYLQEAGRLFDKQHETWVDLKRESGEEDDPIMRELSETTLRSEHAQRYMPPTISLQVDIARGSVFDAIHRVASRLGFCKNAFEETEIGKIELAADEAIRNATTYGLDSPVDVDPNDPEALEFERNFAEEVTIHLEIMCKSNKLMVQIKIIDPGQGFDPSEVDDPAATENLGKPEGRGLAVMRTEMDEVSFLKLPKGFLTEITKTLEPIPDDAKTVAVPEEGSMA